MAHDTHHDTHGHHEVSDKTQSTTSFRSAFFFVCILAGLFIAAVNFVNVMGHDDEGGHGSEHSTEHATEHAAPAHEAGTSHTIETEATPAAGHTEAEHGAAADTTHHAEGH
ncbi:hypothetical protein [Polluticoccus soli]|uniref:hypothetical protein n=1 Tax=Polluticoccus soli TaxID=3034150 RepID=UPI0023E18779|nr:hypothetical protein [Flavipsychrobacter sp. JY13-12]